MTVLWLSASLLLLLVSGDVAADPQDARLLESTQSATMLPSHVDLWYRRSDRSFWECNGYLYSDQFVITVAHCYRYGWYNTFVTCGGQTRYVTHFYEHSRFRHYNRPNEPFAANDIALMKLDEPFTIMENCTTVTLPEKGETFYNKTALSIGYNTTGLYNNLAETVSITMKVLPPDLCKRYFGQYFSEDYHICLKDTSGKERACYMDQATPAIVDSKVTGLGSWIWSNCYYSNSHPVVYTNLASYVEWLQEKSHACRADTSPP